METPKELEERNKLAARGAKDKAVRRELCTILTKGTAAPTSASANYLLSVRWPSLCSALVGNALTVSLAHLPRVPIDPLPPTPQSYLETR
mmetsp:Transcript_3033/g.10206  ORF Transcript_3033/g.10206 Transcript_3033/m.10206 type:complete len:90 (-) Transcript_3033:3447-3716(-)